MIADRITIRPAAPADERAIGDLSLAARRSVLYIPWTDLHRALSAPAAGADPAAHPALARYRAYDMHVVERSGRIGCFWATVIEPATVAQLRALAVHDNWPVSDTLGALLPSVRLSLRHARVTTLAFVGTESWLLESLAANGFVQTNTVVTMQKGGWEIPSLGNPAALVRPVTRQDVNDIVEIDRQAFHPLWRNTPLTVDEFMQASPYFSVAELDRQVAGYAHASLIGRHGHLTRIAVHPGFHGQQIGVRLLADVVRFFQDQRVFGITVNTQQDNARARRLYEWFGFVLLGQEAEVWAITP